LEERMTDNKNDTGHSFAAYFKRATSPLVVLSLLKKQPMYGYEISAEMDRISNGRYTIAVLYPVLYRLQEQGYIDSSASEIVDGRARTYYSITSEGSEYLECTVDEYHKITEVFEGFIRGKK
jgi:PadR family transcriptional regulator PadR